MNKPLELFIETRCQYCTHLRKCHNVSSIDERGKDNHPIRVYDYHMMILCKLVESFEIEPSLSDYNRS